MAKGRIPFWQQEAGPTVFDPQPETSELFKGTDKVWMLNFRVRDLDKLAAHLRAAAIAVEIAPQSYPNGRFASLHEAEGNPIQLWQPAKPAAPRWFAKQFMTDYFYWVTGNAEVDRNEGSLDYFRIADVGSHRRKYVTR